ncbi:MAG: HAD hydrolase-like protein [Ignavibacteria bacterium]|nr:HAD hydrolase-like protein [Ignavibacteria bacterium]
MSKGAKFVILVTMINDFETVLEMKLETMIKDDSVLLFDLDGTLIETDLANFLSYKKAISRVIESEINSEFDLSKRFTRQTLYEVFPGLSSDEYEQIIGLKELFYKDFLPDTKIITPYVNALKKYSKTHRVILVTNCRKKRAEELLHYHKLNGFFHKKFFREMGSDGVYVNKFKKALKSLSVSTESVIVFENSVSEIEDAIRAGISKESIISHIL